MMFAVVSAAMVAIWSALAVAPTPAVRVGKGLDSSHMKGFVLTQGDPRLVQFAPVFLVEGYNKAYNRIGTPSARYTKNGHEDVYVDPARATYYTETRDWHTARGHFTNLIYRVHFEMSKANPKSFNSGKGYNVGLMVIITLDSQGHPVLVNTVHTCGCFHAVIPTNFLPVKDYPSGWHVDHFMDYRERLPGLVRYPKGTPDAHLVVFLRDGSHRVADLQVASLAALRRQFELIKAAQADMNSLYHLRLGKGETSFFYTKGKNKGLVKGAYKLKEAILGPFIGDSHVGQDRAYGSKKQVPRGFYTTLDPADKKASNMWDYARFLRANGWKL